MDFSIIILLLCLSLDTNTQEGHDISHYVLFSLFFDFKAAPKTGVNECVSLFVRCMVIKDLFAVDKGSKDVRIDNLCYLILK